MKKRRRIVYYDTPSFKSEKLFQVVPPGIEPFALVYSNSLSDCTFLLYLL